MTWAGFQAESSKLAERYWRWTGSSLGVLVTSRIFQV
jgi:hypothetical protein